MKKDFRRTLAASGWMDIAVLVVTVEVIAALNRACESDMIGEMLNAFMSKIPSGSGNEPNYGGFLMGFLSIFIVLGWILLLPVIGVACAGLGISFMIECKNEKNIPPCHPCKREHFAGAGRFRSGCGAARVYDLAAVCGLAAR